MFHVFFVFRICFFDPLNHLMEVFGNEFVCFNPYSASEEVPRFRFRISSAGSSTETSGGIIGWLTKL